MFFVCILKSETKRRSVSGLCRSASSKDVRTGVLFEGHNTMIVDEICHMIRQVSGAKPGTGHT